MRPPLSLPLPLILFLQALLPLILAFHPDINFDHHPYVESYSSEEDAHYDAMYEGKDKGHWGHEKWGEWGFREEEERSRRGVCTESYSTCLVHCADQHDEDYYQSDSGADEPLHYASPRRVRCDNRCHRTKVSCLKNR